MEAMWTRFLPSTLRVREWISQGRIGEPRMVQADFSYRTSIEEESRLFDPNYAGGSLLDVGVYCVSYAAMIFGEPPQRIATLADIGRTNVDEQAAMVLGYSNGRLALLSSAIRTTSAQEAIIMGTEGMIRLYPRFWSATRATLIIDEKVVEDVTLPYEGWGYSYEARHVGECLREGKLESGVMPLDESLSIMETMDRIRDQWGMKYPMDR
jgi:predicted dehydrogenase